MPEINISIIVPAYNEEKSPNGGSQGTAKQDECGKKGKLDSRPVSLRVWTSEGVVKASRPVCIFYDMDEVESWRGPSDTEKPRN